MQWQLSPFVITEATAALGPLIMAVYFPWHDLNRGARRTGSSLLIVAALWILTHSLMWTDPGLDLQNPYLPVQPDYGISFIQKPFSGGDLATKIREILDRRAEKADIGDGAGAGAISSPISTSCALSVRRLETPRRPISILTSKNRSLAQALITGTSVASVSVSALSGEQLDILQEAIRALFQVKCVVAVGADENEPCRWGDDDEFPCRDRGPKRTTCHI